jgi:hypothetical protein
MAIISLLLLPSLVPMTGWAEDNAGDRQRRKGPPQEAFEVCAGKQVGDSVTFTGRRGESLTATCEERNEQLVAVPERMRERRGQRERYGND